MSSCSRNSTLVQLLKKHERQLREIEDLGAQRDKEIKKKEQSLTALRHELLAPLAPVQHRLELFRKSLQKKRVLDGKTSKDIRDMLSELLQVQYLIDGVSNLFDDDLVPDKHSGFLFKDVVYPVIQMLKGKTDAKDVKMRLVGVEKFPRLDFDIGLTKELVYNLLLNAIKYCDRNTDITIKAVSDAGSHILLFQDYGIGVPGNWETRIFELWEIGPNAREKKLGGSGLGLAICKRVAEIHHWKLTLAQNRRPTVFRLELS